MQSLPLINDILGNVNLPAYPHICLSQLPIFQRVLLGMDGTVTDMLELYLQEHITVKKLQETQKTAKNLSLDFATDAEETIMARKIVLQSSATQKNYLYSESFILLDRLPNHFKHLLLNSCLPIGKLWSQFRLETFKKILYIEQIKADHVAQYFNIKANDLLYSRCYLVFNQQQVIMQITEQFPCDYYTDNPTLAKK